MGKKSSKDNDGFDWSDEFEWDDRYDEFDDSFDEDDGFSRRSRTKKSASESRREQAAGSTRRTAAKTSSRSGSSAKKTSSGTGKSSASRKSSAGRSASDDQARRREAARKRENQKKLSKKKKRRRILIIVLCVLEALLLAVLAVVIFVVRKVDKIQRPDVSFGPGGNVATNELPQGVVESMKGYTTYAIFGLDARNQSQLNTNQSDVIVLISVNNDTGEISMASVYRDTYLQIDERGTFGKINAAYNRGGAVQALQALNTNLDLNIDHFVTVTWYAVAQAIDLIGGVDIEVSEAIWNAKDPNGGSTYYGYIEQTAASIGHQMTSADYPQGPGYQRLTGLQAVALCRIRQVGMDYGRTALQREVAAQFFEKAKGCNLATLIDIADEVLPNIATDIDPVSPGGMRFMEEVLSSISDYYMGDSGGFPSTRDGRMITDPDGTYWGDCIIPKDLVSNVAELHQILYGNNEYTPSQTVIDLSNTISRATGVYAD